MKEDMTKKVSYPYIPLWTTGRIGFRINDADPGACSAEGLISSNTWYHVVAVVSKPHRAIYINGEIAAEDNSAETYIGGTPTFTRIGYRGPASPSYFKGLIDEVRIYNRALSAEEIKELYLHI